jgi:hypothetical protein
MFSAQSSGLVLPPGTLPKVPLPAGDLTVKILRVYHENEGRLDEKGEAITTSVHDMVDVEMPDGAKHEFQIKPGDKVALADFIKKLLMGKYTVTSFNLGALPEVAVGAEFKFVSVTHS